MRHGQTAIHHGVNPERGPESGDLARPHRTVTQFILNPGSSDVVYSPMT